MDRSPLYIDTTTAVQRLKSGGVVAFPTETVYGLGADARRSDAVRRIYATKGRPSSNPLIVHLPSLKKVHEYADISRSFDPVVVSSWLEKLQHLWPGPLSVILPRGAELAPEVSAGGDSVAFRIPAHPVARELLTAFDGPIAAPSANRSEYVSPTRAEHVLSDLGGYLSVEHDGIISGGECPVGIESAVLSLLDATPRILRPGSITHEQLEKVLGCAVAIGAQGASTREPQTFLSPGLLAKHYAPHTRVQFLTDIHPSNQLPARVGAILFSDRPLPFEPHTVIVLSPDSNLEVVAAGLFAALRELDSEGLDLILVDSCEATGLGAAIMDRLRRASFR